VEDIDSREKAQKAQKKDENKISRKDAKGTANGREYDPNREWTRMDTNVNRS
jgi:hypothetical protein